MKVLNICQEDIKWKPVQTKHGVKHYANIAVDYLREPDDKGNVLTVWNNQTQEQRAEKAKKEYCGRGKEYKFDAKKEYANTNKQEMEDQDNMPF